MFYWILFAVIMAITFITSKHADAWARANHYNWKVQLVCNVMTIITLYITYQIFWTWVWVMFLVINIINVVGTILLRESYKQQGHKCVNIEEAHCVDCGAEFNSDE